MAAVIIIGLSVLVAGLIWLATDQSRALKKYETPVKKTKESRKNK